MWLGHSVLAIAQRRHGCIDPWIRKIPCKRKWQPTPVFLTGKPHEQRAQMDYSPWGHKELDMTEHTHTPHPTHTHSTTSSAITIRKLTVGRRKNLLFLSLGNYMTCLGPHSKVKGWGWVVSAWYFAFCFIEVDGWVDGFYG